MTRYQKIPIELIAVYGELELPPGEYKTGKLNRMEEGDVVLTVDSQMYTYTKVINCKVEYHHDGGPAIEHRDGYQEFWKNGKNYLP